MENDRQSLMMGEKFTPIARSDTVRLSPRRESADGTVEFAGVEEIRKNYACEYDSGYTCYTSKNDCPHKSIEECGHIKEVKLNRLYR